VVVVRAAFRCGEARFIGVEQAEGPDVCGVDVIGEQRGDRARRAGDEDGGTFL